MEQDNIFGFPMERRFSALPDFETALGHLVLVGVIDAQEAYDRMTSEPLWDHPPNAA